MTGPQPLPGPAMVPIDSDDDVVDNGEDLPDDIPNDEVIASEEQVPAGGVADTDVDAPVVGAPLSDDEIGA